MSRTNKDKPYWKRCETHFRNKNTKDKEQRLWLEPHERALQRKEVDTEYHWTGSTPSWWNNLFHTRPERNKAHQFSIKATKSEDLEELDYPNFRNKPHKYYY